MKSYHPILLLLAYSLTHAQNNNGIPQAVEPFGCKSNITASDLGFTVSQHFSDIQRVAVDLSVKFCNALNNPIENQLPIQDLAEFGLFAEAQAVRKFSGSSEQAEVAMVMRLFATTIDSGENFPTLMPDFDVAEPASGQGAVVHYSSSSHADDLGFVMDTTENGTCVQSNGVTCRELLEDLSNAINPYKRSYQISNAKSVADQLTILHHDWNSYFDNARSMTTLDLALTTWIERTHMTQGFLVGPIKRQWFALHPNLVLEYVGAASEGDKFKGALSVEWFGVNYWQDGPFGIPIGVSLTSVYSDRPNVKGVGHGITLHFDNRYSIGWAKHGNDSSYNVSVDLLEFFKDKKSEFNKYKARVKNLR